MYYHLIYSREFGGSDLPIRDMTLTLETYSSSASPISKAAKMNNVCGYMERFKVYESPSKRFSNKSKMIFCGLEGDI